MRGALFDRLMGMDAEAGQLAPGTLVGSFHIIRIMAKSASASVYLGRRTGHPDGSVVVIQVTNSATLNERPAGSDTDHHNRARILDSGVLGDGRAWTAKELVD